MAVEPILWLDDRNHISVTATVFSASSTAANYAIDNAREADLDKAWKPSDGTADEYLMVDLGSATGIGAAGLTGWGLIAYDARGADQVEIELRSDAADNPAGTFASVEGVFTLTKTEVVCDWVTWVIRASGRRYYRLYQYNVDRGGGTITAKVLYWAMVGESGIVRVGVGTYSADSHARHTITEIDRQGFVRTPGGVTFSNKWAAPGQAFTVNLDPARKVTWQAIRDKLRSSGGRGRPYFVQFEGLSNPGGVATNFFLSRPTREARGASVEFIDLYAMQIEHETEAWV